MLARIVAKDTWLLAALLAVIGVLGLTVLLPRDSTDASSITVLEHPAGTIYCRVWPFQDTCLWQMNADDRALRPLPQGVCGEPSRQLHAGHRWFVDVRMVEGQTYPDGGTRQELFAACDDGRAVRLTDMPDLEPMAGSPKWPAHGQDSLISWIGRRWDSQGRIVEQGIYTLQVRYDARSGGLKSLEPVGRLVISLPLLTAPAAEVWCRAAVPDAGSHDWSPDGREIAFVSVHGRLSIADLKTGRMRDLTVRPALDPSWSPDGSMIVFKIREPLGGIATVSRDGSDFEQVFGRSEPEPFAVGSPQWSPSGKCVAFGYLTGRERAPERPVKMDLMMTRMADAAVTSHTISVPESLMPVAWR